MMKTCGKCVHYSRHARACECDVPQWIDDVEFEHVPWLVRPTNDASDCSCFNPAQEQNQVTP
jgi:hypothetical protein